VPGIPQHVTQRGNNRQTCFFNNADYALYLKLLTKACRRHDCAVHAYALMTNHVHLLITPKFAEGVSLVMRDLGRDYVREVNKVYDRTGTLWEGRFKSSLVDEEAYCIACYRYIELNPVRARLVTLPNQYPWSSFKVNALGSQSDLITPHQCWMALGRWDHERRRSYLALFDEALTEAEMYAIRYGVRKGIPTGSVHFTKEIEKTLSVKIGDGRQGRPTKQPRD
jgi:putative transposase